MAYQDYIKVRDRVAFGFGPYAASPTWTDITKPDGSTDNAVRPGGTFATGRQTRNGQVEAASVTLATGNRDGRYTPFYSASPYYPLTESAPYLRDVEYPKGSGTYYPIWGGVLADCRAGFEGRAQGTASLTFQQRLALVSKKPLRALSAGRILDSSPAHFWPFDDADGSDEAADPRGIGYSPLTAQYVGSLQNQAGGGAYAFGVGDAPGDPGGSRLEVTAGSTTEGYFFGATLPTESAQTAHQLTAITTYDGSLADNQVIASVFFPANNVMYALQYEGRQYFLQCLKITGLRPGGAPPSDILAELGSPGTYSLPGEDHALGVTISMSGTTATIRLYVDGDLLDSDTFTVPAGSLTLGKVHVYGSDAPILNTQMASGSIANVAIWNNIDTSRNQDAYDSALGFAQDTADVRFARLAALAGVSSSWIDTVGSFTRLIGTQATAGRDFVECLKELEISEIGRLYHDHEGRIVLAANNAFHTPARTLTLSAATSFNLGDDFGVDNDNAVNDWRGTRDGGGPQTYLAPDEVIEEQGRQSKDAGSLPLTTDDDVHSVGAWNVNTTAVPTLRFNKVIVHASKLHSLGLLDDALALTEGDQLVLQQLPTGSPATSFTGFIERIEKAFTAEDLKLVFTLSQWIDIAEFDSASVGRFAEDVGSITLTSTVTAAATSISATTASGSPPLTNAAGDLPFDISLNGERCTVTAVSSATSPQTLTVTRAVAPTTASAHSAGSVIEIWNPGIFGI